MGDRTGIEWTNATWNPVTGCTKITAGCDNCYAHALAHTRLRDVYLRRLPVADTPANRADPFAVRLWPERLDQPLAWSSPKMVFVNSMSDLFHRDVPDDYVRTVFEVMLTADWHNFQILTKRPARAARFWKQCATIFGLRRIPGHIWVGTSVETQDVVYRVRQIQKLPAGIRFLSCEPLLGPLQLDLEGIQWVIVGGESGPGFRPMDRSWAVAIRDQCIASGVPFFFKQWGGITPKAGGNRLDGKTWREYPLLENADFSTA